MKTIRWGIIGCGNVTEVKSGPGLQQAEHSTLVAVMRRSGDLARDYAERHKVPKWYDNAEQLIHDPEVDAVYIATPPDSHKEYTILTAKAGKPVYVEKPMAMTHGECQEMIKVCRDAGVPLFVAYYRRALARFIQIKEWIRSGAIGDVRFVKITLYQPPTKQEMEGTSLPWRVIPEISGGGKFEDVGCHTLDVLDFILGPIEQAAGFASNQAKLYRAADMVSANFVFSSGVHGVGTWCFSSAGHYERNEIIGSKGQISFSSFNSDIVDITDSEGTRSISMPDPVHIQQPLIQTIVNDLNGIAVCPSKGESAARTSLVMDQIMGR